MELRLSVTERAGSTTVQVDGRLTASGLSELERLVRGLEGPIVVDLSNLLSADDVGVAELRNLAGRGMKLIGASPYVSLLLGHDRAKPGTSPKTGRASRRKP
jgi:hypothetical protein